MERQKVASSQIAEIGYDPASQKLEICFCAGTVYVYDGVPQEEYDALISAESKGSHFGKNIRGKYPYEKTPETKEPAIQRLALTLKRGKYLMIGVDGVVNMGDVPFASQDDLLKLFEAQAFLTHTIKIINGDAIVILAGAYLNPDKPKNVKATELLNLFRLYGNYTIQGTAIVIHGDEIPQN